MRAILRRALERKGYDVECASNGEEAMALIQAADPPIQLLISDVVMPTMDGPTLVGKARELIPDLRVILISGYAEEQLRQLMDSTNFIFLPKPFSVQQLAEVVGRALQSA
ncbi:response regulator [Hankyongella ginsenosidimutans]|uniref:response regulator n=1 Tax=Hankyongella ginsenosidimutans TaxID=1763828 RepID=UPI001CA362DD|nr:response regulator [Hankyongella ginsenosidimutans]